MRLTIADHLSPDPRRRWMAHHSRILLNGKEVEACVLADTDLGAVEYATMNKRGEYFLDCTGNVHTSFAFGTVVIDCPTLMVAE